MGKINFDAQEAEANLEGHEIVVGGKTIALPARLSLRFGRAMEARDLDLALGVLIGDPDDQETIDHLLDHLSVDDLNQIAEELYGLTDDEGAEPAPNRAARRAGSTARGA